jgi:hypothetical protein
VPGVTPGQEPAELITIIGIGVLIFLALVIYLSVKLGVKSTFRFLFRTLTIGLWPRREPHHPHRDAREPVKRDERRTGTRFE